jgi:hypothetical protein
MYLWASPGDERRALLLFDFSSVIMPATFSSATLCLTVVSQTGSGTLDLDAFEVDTPWIEDEATWDRASDAVPWQTPGGDKGALVASGSVDTQTQTPSYLVCVDVTRYVAAKLAPAATNNGLVLAPGGASSDVHINIGSSENANADHRPVLALHFCDPI